MKSALMFAMILPAAAWAGEQTFMTGNVRLINKPFALVKPFLPEPTHQEERCFEPGKQMTFSDGSSFTNPDVTGCYQRYVYEPVRLLPEQNRERVIDRMQASKSFNCRLKITVRPDGNISLLGSRGADCDFDLAAHVFQ